MIDVKNTPWGDVQMQAQPQQAPQAPDAQGNVSEGYPYENYDPFGQINMPYQNFNMPEQWTQAADWFQNMMMGGGVGASPYWGTAGNVLTGMAQTGRPVDVSGLYGAMEPIAARQLEDYTKQAAEQAGLTGTRWSSPLMHNIADFSGRLSENMALAQTRAGITAEEAARQRMLQATGQLGSLGQMESNLGLANMANQMSAANQYAGLGTQMFNAPMQVAGQMFGMGQGMQGAQGQQIQQMMNDPYLALALSMAGQNQYMPQQYTPGWASQLLNIGGGLLPLLMGGNYQTSLGETQVPPGRDFGNLPYVNPTARQWGQ